MKTTMHTTMKKILTLTTAAALTATASATSYAPPENHEVKSTNEKFKLHVNVDSNIHKLTGEFASGVEAESLATRYPSTISSSATTAWRLPS
jgi:hypothetical protein